MRGNIDYSPEDRLQMQSHIRCPTRKLSTYRKHIARESLYHTTFRQAFVDEENSELTVSPCLKKRVRDRIKGEWKKLECEDRGEESIIMLFHIFIDTYMRKCRDQKP